MNESGSNSGNFIHLEPFLDGTPFAIERLKGAWPGLALSDRAYLLSTLLGNSDKPRALHWINLRQMLIELALTDPNAYIRYLAAYHAAKLFLRMGSKGHPRPMGMIDADSSTLVKAALYEAEFRDPPRLEGDGPFSFINDYDPASYWKLDRTTRLAVAVPNSSSFSGPDLLRYATKELLPNGAVAENDMLDVLLQDLGPDFARRFAEKRPRPNRSDSHFQDEVEGYWKLIPNSETPEPRTS